MASLNSEIVIRQELRPCTVHDRRGLFHRWIDHNNRTYALIETEDGHMIIVIPTKVKFIDGKVNEYAWEI